MLIVQSNHGLSVDKPHSLDIDGSSVWIYASTISEVSKIVKFRSYGRSTTMDSKIVTPGDVKCRLILKLVKAFMMANLIVLSGDVSVNPGPSFGRVDFGEAAQVQGTITDTTVFGKLHTRGISISHLNVRGLRSSLDELRLLLKNQTIDVFSISESWLNINVCDEELKIEGYNLIRKDRSYANGGGVAVYIKNKFAFSRRPELETANLESLWLEVKIPMQIKIAVNFSRL